MRGTRWPDGNRVLTAVRYLMEASRWREELLKGKEGEELREGIVATDGLRHLRERERELVDWLGEFDSAARLVEEWPIWGRWVVWSGIGERPAEYLGSRWVPKVRPPKEGARRGGSPPEWVAGWMGQVAARGRGERLITERAMMECLEVATKVDRMYMNDSMFSEYMKDVMGGDLGK